MWIWRGIWIWRWIGIEGRNRNRMLSVVWGLSKNQRIPAWCPIKGHWVQCWRRDTYKCNCIQLLLCTSDHLWCTPPTHLYIINEAAWLGWVTGRLPVGSTQVPSAWWRLAVWIQACTEATCIHFFGHSEPWHSRSRTTDYRYHQIKMAIADVSIWVLVNRVIGCKWAILSVTSGC